MVMLNISRVSETVTVTPRPSYQLGVVSSQLEVAGHRRHRVQVSLRPVLFPVKYSETHHVFLNNTRKRFVSRTFYEPRLRPTRFSDTEFAFPKTLQERFVSYLDYNIDERRKWFKTSLEIKPRNMKLPQSEAGNAFDPTSDGPRTRNGPCSHRNRGEAGDVNNNEDGRLMDKFDPGASQVFIPKRRRYDWGQQCVDNGQIKMDVRDGNLLLAGTEDCPGVSDF